MKRLFFSRLVVVFSTLLLVLAGLPLRPGLARGVFQISSGNVSDVVWIEHYKLTYTGAAFYADILATDYMLARYERDPSLPPTVVAEEARNVRELFYKTISTGQSEGKTIEESVVNVFLSIAGNVEAKSATRGVVTEVLKEVKDHYFQRRKAEEAKLRAEQAAQASMFSGAGLAAMTDEHADPVLENLREGSATMPNLREAFDMLHVADLHVSANANAQEVFNRSPILSNLHEIKDMLGPNGVINTNINELKASVTTELKKLNDQIAKDTALLIELDKKQQIMVDWVNEQREKEKNAAEKAAQEAKQRQEQADRQLTLQSAKAAVSLLANFISYSDPRLGRQVQGIGNAAFQIADSIGTLVSLGENMGQLSTLATGLTSAAATGNIIGAIMSIASLLEDQGPSPDQLILEGISSIRQDIAQLSERMDARFDRIDQSLGTIYRTMNERFYRLDQALHSVRLDLQEIQKDLKVVLSDLTELQASVDRVEKTMYDTVVAGHKHPLKQRINAALSFYERYGVVLPYLGDENFTGSESFFHTWATTLSYDFAKAGSGVSCDNASLATQLGSFRLEENLGYLARCLPDRYGQAGEFVPAGKSLPHFGLWVMSTRAYAELLMQWPNYGGRAPGVAAGIHDIKSVGDDLATAFQNLTLKPGNQANRQLFDAVLNDYDAEANSTKADSLRSWLQALEKPFVERMAKELTRTVTIDLWGGPDQEVNPEYVATSHGLSSNALQSYIYWKSLQKVLPKPIRLAIYLGIDGITAAAETTRPATGLTDEEQTVVLSYQGRRLATYYVTYFRAHPRPNPEGDTGSAVTLRDQQPERTSEETENLKQLRTDVEKKLIAEQKRFYAFVGYQLMNSTPDAVKRLTGVKALLASILTLGMPRALSGDDYLHSLVYGSQGLIDTRVAGQMYFQASLPTTALSSTHNLRLDVERDLARRSLELRRVIFDHLNLIALGKEDVSQPALEIARGELEIARDKVTRYCFKETGNKCVFGTFYDYWNKHGDLHNFGFPISNASDDPNTATGRTYLTQWFQRNRMEWHTEQLGTPYEMQLGLIGVERLNALNRAEEIRAREAGPVAGCRWFEQTGHNVCNQEGALGFLAYWETHGVADQRLSPEARSLYLFGLPLTEAHEELASDGKIYLTQWFERARFEWHPENADPQFRVLLGLLGSESHTGP